MKARTAAASILSGLVTLSLAGSLATAQSPAPERPRITGISHVGYFVSDLPKALDFWHGLLGYDEMYTLNKSGAKGSSTDQVRIAFIKLNDHQHVELFTDPPPSPPNMMSHLCFAVSNLEQMRAYLKSKGIAVPAGNGGKTHTGDYAFEIHDPDGTLIEFVQSLPTGWEAQAKGKFLPSTRISHGIYHVGFLVGNAEKSLHFYEDILGFKETWRGGRDPKILSWINLRVPDGTDYIELMLYAKLPNTYGTQNHTSLVVPDMAKAIAELQSRPAYKTYGKPLEMHVGVNGKRQVNLYDPDGTRVELMEPFTADGKPVPSSTAPPPPPAHD
ncbi:MAG TPA: VOC family protein [Terracidiphilus sp.]|jgi:lactoylglutathione lyase|nr:VOC family protein [Terracidiphilus sp.]